MALAPGAPTWRGRLHLLAAFAAVPLLVLLVLRADHPAAHVAAAVFGVGLVVAFGTSAAYHRFAPSERVRAILRRLDHATIYLLIAATYVPVCLLALPPAWGVPLLCVVAGGAIAGVVVQLVRFGRAGKLPAALYLVLGWAALAATPAMVRHLGPAPLALLLAGGVAYTAGAVLFFTKRCDWAPARFGYHEVWHSFTVVAAGCHSAAVALLVR